MYTPRKNGFVSNVDNAPVGPKNRLVRALTWTHVAVPVTIFFGYALGLLYFTYTQIAIGFVATAALFFGGMFTFTLLEYLIHRYIFHMFAVTETTSGWTPHKQHGIHHDYPKDKSRLAMPPIASISIATIILLLFQLFLNQYAYAFTAGVVSGYASYLLVHYIVHIYRQPQGFWKYLWVNHAIHHYVDETVMYGVTTAIWDHVFGTAKAPETARIDRKTISQNINTPKPKEPTRAEPTGTLRQAV